MTIFSPQHQEYRKRLRSFVEAQFLPHADKWEAAQTLPRSVFLDLGTEGHLGMNYPVAYGGRELDFGYTVILSEELPRSHMMGLSLSVLAHTTFFAPLLLSQGTEEIRRAFLTPSIRGEKVGALAVTEPGGGSDFVRAIECRADDDGDFWVLNGEKKFITNGPIADFVLVLARTRPEPSVHSLTLLVVPADTPGFRVKESMRKLGMHTSPTGWLSFDGCRIPKSYTLGKPHLGYFYVTHNLHQERLVGAISAVAAAQLVLDDTIGHLKRRIAYGRPLGELQAVRHTISDIAAELEMARRFAYSVSEEFRDGQVAAKEISMIKFKVVEIVQRNVERCLQLHGGAGFLEDNWVTRCYRDVRVLSLGGGVSELMKDLVASYLRL
ncbi:MAG: acyl-CoA dehydrogenase family protein [Deltaproteobacteria bacterium]|nr:acyl-CoA dehydrogenase family protein [Deltaproteobacteria bacterium]